MKYAKIENNEIAEGPRTLPRTFRTPSGGTITGFDCLDAESLAGYDWLPVEYTPLGNYQRHGSPVIETARVYYPAEDWSDEAKRAAIIANAQALRNEAVEADIEVYGVVWQVDQTARDRMRSAIETATRQGAAPETTVDWILSDDTTRPTTAAELGAVLDAYTLRMSTIFAQYTAWLAADPLATTFSIEG